MNNLFLKKFHLQAKVRRAEIESEHFGQNSLPRQAFKKYISLKSKTDKCSEKAVSVHPGSRGHSLSSLKEEMRL
jgi:hypothetical protein